VRHLPLLVLQLQSTPDPKVLGRPLPNGPSRSALVVPPHLDVFLLLLARGLVASLNRLWDSLRLRSLPGVRHTLRRLPLNGPGSDVTTAPDPLVPYRCDPGANTETTRRPWRSLAEVACHGEAGKSPSHVLPSGFPLMVAHAVSTSRGEPRGLEDHPVRCATLAVSRKSAPAPSLGFCFPFKVHHPAAVVPRGKPVDAGCRHDQVAPSDDPPPGAGSRSHEDVASGPVRASSFRCWFGRGRQQGLSGDGSRSLPLPTVLRGAPPTMKRGPQRRPSWGFSRQRTPSGPKAPRRSPR